LGLERHDIKQIATGFYIFGLAMPLQSDSGQ